MSKVYHQFASGWVKNGGKGQYISCIANGQRDKVKLFAQLENGEQVPVNSFAVFFNSAEDKGKPTQPDARFVFTTEE